METQEIVAIEFTKWEIQNTTEECRNIILKNKWQRLSDGYFWMTENQAYNLKNNKENENRFLDKSLYQGIYALEHDVLIGGTLFTLAPTTTHIMKDNKWTKISCWYIRRRMPRSSMWFQFKKNSEKIH